jgi:hypothetical protein
MKRKLVNGALIIALVVACCNIDTYAATDNYKSEDSISASKSVELKGNFVAAPSATPTPKATVKPSAVPTKKPSAVPTSLPTKKPSVVYNIDIKWESMQFSYTMGDEVWNADKHKMEVPQGGISGKWSKGKNNGITFTNYSTVKLSANLGFSASNSSNVKGAFNRDSNGTGTTIKTMSLGPKNGANSGTGYLILSGVPSHKWLANKSKPVGKVTVKINN